MKYIIKFTIYMLLICTISFAEESQALELHAGNNYISFHVLPADPSFAEIFQPINNELIGIIGSGWSLQPNPLDDQILIGDGPLTIDPHLAFTVVVSNNTTLYVTGEFLDPTMTYELAAGSNHISYPYNQPQIIDIAVPDVFLPLITSISWEDQTIWPDGDFSGWQGDFDIIEPGKGYTINLSESVEFYWNNPISMGDVNSDLIVDVLDVVRLIGIILSDEPSVFQLWAGDFDGDGVLTVADIVSVVDIIIG
ncbi:MAG: hypothetical protein GXO91_09445 [FCB group bacterium]|nr:hypothetical protein [FCB group bacterium]